MLLKLIINFFTSWTWIWIPIWSHLLDVIFIIIISKFIKIIDYEIKLLFFTSFRRTRDCSEETEQRQQFYKSPTAGEEKKNTVWSGRPRRYWLDRMGFLELLKKTKQSKGPAFVAGTMLGWLSWPTLPQNLLFFSSCRFIYYLL